MQVKGTTSQPRDRALCTQLHVRWHFGSVTFVIVA
jgi:hypothetical protein